MGAMARTEPTLPYALAARELLRTTLLDAAHDLLRDRSWREVTMADVAAAAGVSRQTLYKEFGSREEFAQAYVLKEGDRFLTAVERAIRENAGDAGLALREAFDVFLEGAREDPLVRAVVSGQGDELLPLVTTQGQPLVERATERLCGVIAETWPHASDADALLLAECLVRLAISHAALPVGPAQMDGAAVTRLLGPFVEQALG